MRIEDDFRKSNFLTKQAPNSQYKSKHQTRKTQSEDEFDQDVQHGIKTNICWVNILAHSFEENPRKSSLFELV